MTLSKYIDAAILLAEAEGNSVVEISTGWSNVKEAVYMKFPLSEDLRRTLEAIHQLEYWIEYGTPHNRPEEGFVDRAQKVDISFPLTGIVTSA